MAYAGIALGIVALLVAIVGAVYFSLAWGGGVGAGRPLVPHATLQPIPN